MRGGREKLKFNEGIFRKWVVRANGGVAIDPHQKIIVSAFSCK